MPLPGRGEAVGITSGPCSEYKREAPYVEYVDESENHTVRCTLCGKWYRLGELSLLTISGAARSYSEEELQRFRDQNKLT